MITMLISIIAIACIPAALWVICYLLTGLIVAAAYGFSPNGKKSSALVGCRRCTRPSRNSVHNKFGFSYSHQFVA